MNNKSYTRGCLLTLLIFTFISGFLYLFILLYGELHIFNRTFVADVNSIGYEVSFSEIEHDSILVFNFKRKIDNKTLPPLFVYNRAWDVVSFVIQKDSIYVRDEMELQDIFPPTERTMSSITISNSKRNQIIKGKLPYSYHLIPFSDSVIFVFDRNLNKYIPKDSSTHIIKLCHFVERTNTYQFLDETLNDTSLVDLHEIFQQCNKRQKDR